MLALGLLVVFLPALASTAAGAAYISSRASALIPGTVKLEGLRLSWGAGQAVESVSLLDLAGDEVATASGVELPDLSLLAMLGGRRDPGTIVVESVWARVVLDEEGNSGLQAALADPAAPPNEGGPPPWAALFRLRLGSATVEFSHPEAGEAQVVVGSFSAQETAAGGEVSLSATILADGETGQVSADLTFGLPANGNLEEATVAGEVVGGDLPVALLDSLVGTRQPTALLGPGLNVGLTVSGPILSPRLELAATSVRLNLLQATFLLADGLALEEPATISLRLTPASWADFVASGEKDADGEGSGEPARLAAPAEILLLVDSLTIPVGPDGLDLPRLAFAATLTAKRLEFAAGDEGEVATVTGLAVAASTEALGSGLDISVDAVLGHRGVAAPVNAKATVSGLAEEGATPSWQVSAQAKGLPVAAAGILLGQASWPVAVLGATADLAVDIGEEQDDGSRSWAATAETATMDMALAGTVKGGRLLSDPGASVLFLMLTPEGLAALQANFAPPPSGPPLALDEATILRLTRIALDVDGGADDAAKATLTAAFAAPVIRMSRAGEPIVVHGLEAVVTATAGPDGLRLEGEAEATITAARDTGAMRADGEAGWPLAGEAWARGEASGEGLSPQALDTLLGTGGRLAPLLGGPVRFALAGDSSVTPPNLAFRLASPNLSAQVSLESDQDGGVAGEGEATLHLTPAALAAFAAPGEDTPRLLAPADISLQVDRLVAPAGEDGPDWARASIGATVVVGFLSLAPAGGGPGALLEGLEASLRADELGRMAHFLATAQFSRDGVMAATSADLTLTGLLAPDGAAPGVAGTVRLERLGLGAVAAMLGAPSSLTALVGESAEATMDLNLPAGGVGAGSAAVVVDGDLVSLALALETSDGRLRLAGHSDIHLTLTPAGFDALLDLAPSPPVNSEEEPKPPLRLLSTADLGLTLTGLDIPWGAEGGKPGALAFQITGDALALAREGVAGQARISGLDASLIMVLGPGGVFAAQAEATLAGNGAGSPLSFAFTTLAPDPEAAADAPPPPLHLELRGEDLPIPALDILFGTDGLLEALVGPRGAVDLDLDLRAGTAGRLDLEMAGAVSTVSAHGPVESALTLDSDALATLEITPALGARILGLVNPLLMNALSGDGPVLATVEAATLRLPLRPFSVGDAEADIVVEIGEVVIGNGGLVEAILQALGQRQPERSVASFTPARISLRDGMLTYYPVTMTMGSFQVTLQGVVDLATREVAATLSLPKSSLAPALGDLADLLEDDYVLVVPVGGTVDSPEVDKGVIGDVLGDLLARLAIRALVGGLFGG